VVAALKKVTLGALKEKLQILKEAQARIESQLRSQDSDGPAPSPSDEGGER
jgi:hypothetical protein